MAETTTAYPLDSYTNRKRMNSNFEKGKPVWVMLKDGSARDGSIGQAYPVDKVEEAGEPFTFTAGSHYHYYGVNRLDVFFPGKKPKRIDLGKKELHYLPYYKGKGENVFVKGAPKQKHFPLDLMGKPITPGCMIIYTNRAGVLRFGKVEEVSESGLSVLIRTIDIENAQYTSAPSYSFRSDGLLRLNTKSNLPDKRCEQINVIRSDLLTDLMMVKLQIK